MKVDWLKAFTWAGGLAFCIAAWRLAIIAALWLYTSFHIWKGMFGL